MAIEAPLYLAIDQGGHSTRVAVADAEGGVVATHTAPVETLVRGDRAEQDAEALLASVHDGLHRVEAQLGRRAGSVAAAGLAVQRASVVCWDRETGAALSPILSWLDRRGTDLLTASGLDPETIRARTGLHLSPHYGASKLAWCLRELPAVRRAADAARLGFGPLSSYLVWRLSGGAAWRVDATTAQRTLLWDRNTGDWSPESCTAFGIPTDALPPVVSCDAGFGTLGLGGRAVPLDHCAGDQGLVLSACGPPDPDAVSINAGTGAFVLMPLAPEAQPGDAGLLRTLAWAGTGETRWAEEGTVNGAAAALDRLGRDDLPVEPGTEGDEPMFLNGVGGLGAPWWIGDYPSRFVGRVRTMEDRERLVVESIVFLLMANVSRMHRPPQRVRLTGGLSRRADLCRWLADALGLPVDVPADREATTRGLLATLSPDIAAHVPEMQRIDPDATARARWQERQERWEAVLLGNG